jgi:hypothetical protein
LARCLEYVMDRQAPPTQICRSRHRAFATIPDVAHRRGTPIALLSRLASGRLSSRQIGSRRRNGARPTRASAPHQIPPQQSAPAPRPLRPHFP